MTNNCTKQNIFGWIYNMYGFNKKLSNCTLSRRHVIGHGLANTNIDIRSNGLIAKNMRPLARGGTVTEMKRQITATWRPCSTIKTPDSVEKEVGMFRRMH